jgi:hypothetical protein
MWNITAWVGSYDGFLGGVYGGLLAVVGGVVGARIVGVWQGFGRTQGLSTEY